MSKTRNKAESQTVQNTEKETVQSVTHVEMVRDAERYPAPHTANVHVDEIDNFKTCGWVLK